MDMETLDMESATHAILCQLTKHELNRLANRLWHSMTDGDGYQPFGYDFRTMKINHPIDWPVYLMVLNQYKSVCKELEAKQ